jgi:hypothetical protein
MADVTISGMFLSLRTFSNHICSRNGPLIDFAARVITPRFGHVLEQDRAGGVRSTMWVERSGDRLRRSYPTHAPSERSSVTWLRSAGER